MLVTFTPKTAKSAKTGPDDDTSHNLSVRSTKMLNADDDNGTFISFGTKRSKHGCMTCKIRKKKCDEMKPVCSDCKRLHKECLWPDYDTMDQQTIKALRDRVQENESNRRIRNRKGPKNHEDRSSVKPPSKHIFVAPKLHNDSNIPVNKVLFPQLDPIENKIKRQKRQMSQEIEELKRVESKSSFKPAAKVTDLTNISETTDFENVLGKPSPDSLIDALNRIKPPSGFVSELDSPQDSPQPLSPNNDDRMVKYWPSFTPPPYASFFAELEENAAEGYDASLQAVMNPSPKPNPSLFPDLSYTANYLYNYYSSVVAPSISIAPKKTTHDYNYYQNVFLPLAQNDHGVMNAVLSWACFHHGGKWLQEGNEYRDKALQYFHNNHRTDRASVINRVATLLILIGAEICRGDVKNWVLFLEWGSNMINTSGGVFSFNNNKEEHWLISNFAYHDVLSSNNSERGTYFPTTAYNEVFNNEFAKGIFNPIVGISKQVFSLIGDIGTLASEVNKNLNNLSSEIDKDTGEPIVDSELLDEYDLAYEKESEMSIHARTSKVLISVATKAKLLDHQIDEAKPNPQDLMDLNDDEFEWQITLFETFKISAKLYLRQAIYKHNPSSLESQILNNDLTKCLDIIIGTPVQPTLMFPIFIAGIHCVTAYERQSMMKRIDDFIEHYGPWSTLRVKFVIEKIWEENPNGDRAVDWQALLKKLGWSINFA